METAELMDALESADRGSLTDQSSDDDEVPPTQQAEVHQELPLQGGTSDASTESATQAKLRKTKGGEDEIREHHFSFGCNSSSPSDLTRSMQAAIKAARMEQRPPGELDDRVKRQGIALDIVASVDPKLWKFSSGSWFEDRKWLGQDWRQVNSDVELFAHATKTRGLSATAVRDRHRVLANEIISKFLLADCAPTIVTHRRWGGQQLQRCHGRYQVQYPPCELEVESLGHHFVRPIEVTRKRLRVHVFLYEPLIDDGYREDWRQSGQELKRIRTTRKPRKRRSPGFVERWLQATSPGFKLCIDAVDWIETPQHRISCGVLVVAQAYNFFTGYPELQHYNVSKANVKVMRLQCCG
ncbi:hypothetical protein GQ600_14848 [Phytophthora cactorum]|nr:hypothetical protein GQ600_14848 [Phytophthora cactorum]